MDTSRFYGKLCFISGFFRHSRTIVIILKMNRYPFLTLTKALILSNSWPNYPHFMTEFFSTPTNPTLEILFQVYVLLLCDESNIEKRGKTIGRIFIATIQLRTLLTFMVKSVSTAGVNYKSQRGIWVSGRGCLFEPLGVGN